MKLVSHARAVAASLLPVSVLALPLSGGPAAAQGEVDCGHARCSPASIVLKGDDNGPRDDRLMVNGPSFTAGAETRLFRREDGDWIKIASGVLNDRGNAWFRVEDLNGRSLTRYLARVAATEETYRSAAKKQVR